MVVFKLSANLTAHSSDVKALCPGPRSSVITGSRDFKAILFTRNEDKRSFSPSVAISHQNFVNAVAFMPPHPAVPEGVILSAGKDKVILGHSPNNASQPLFTLTGHTDNVCALHTSQLPNHDQPTIISGSWDKTARVWLGGKCLYVLSGHSLAVWAVLLLPNGDILTGSADKTIKVWREGTCIKTLTGHTDCVRGLALLPGIGFVSCANDGSLRIWSEQGECVQELYGHTSFVYSVDVLPTREIVSSGEDRSVRVWRDGECVQTINLPAVSIWCVRALENGDIVAGSNDGFGRIFTRSDERVADDNVLREFDDALASFAIPKNQVGDLNKEKLPGPEALEVPGKTTGDVKVLKVNGNVEAYQWNGATSKWEKIGDVVDAVGNDRKTMFQGKEYDYVFDVDLDDGLPSRKLPYNVTENPFSAAQAFIHREELSQGFLDQIAQFIIANTKGASLGFGNSEFYDPYTGQNRYAGGAGSSSQSQPPPQSYSQPQSGFMDPFTGANRYSGQGSSSSNDVKMKEYVGYYPKKTYVSYDDAIAPQASAKFLEFNSQLPQELEARLTSQQEAEISSVVELAKSAQAPSEGALSMVHKIFAWPADKRFPGLDILRGLLLNPQVAERLLQDPSFLEKLLEAGCYSEPESASKPIQNNQLLGMKCLVNLFKHDRTRSALWEGRRKVLDKLWPCVGSERPTLRAALVSVFLNFAVFLNQVQDEELGSEVFVALLEMMKKEQDQETTFRALVTLGTLIQVQGNLKDLFNTLEGPGTIQPFHSSQDERIRNASRALSEIV